MQSSFLGGLSPSGCFPGSPARALGGHKLLGHLCRCLQQAKGAKLYSLGPWNVTIYGERVFVDVIKLRMGWGEGLSWFFQMALNAMARVSRESGTQGSDAEKGDHVTEEAGTEGHSLQSRAQEETRDGFSPVRAEPSSHLVSAQCV